MGTVENTVLVWYKIYDYQIILKVHLQFQIGQKMLSFLTGNLDF